MAKVDLSIAEKKIHDIEIDDTLLDDQFAEDFLLVDSTLRQQISRFGYSWLAPSELDGKQIDKYLLTQMNKYGRVHGSFIPKKVKENVFDRNYCFQITGLKEPYWVFFHPYFKENAKSNKHRTASFVDDVTMDHQRIYTLSTAKGRYHVASLRPKRTFVFKSHCVRRVQERTDPQLTETQAMTALAGIAYDPNVTVGQGMQDFIISELGGVVKARVGTAKYKIADKLSQELVDDEHHLILCYTYYPPSFLV